MARAAAGSHLQEALQRLGAKRVEATLVACLVETGPLGTTEIVERTGLRQPEVSVGMQVLRERDWVESEPIPREGKGRPMHRYQLKADLATIRRHYEELGQQTVQGLQHAIEQVKQRLT